MRVLLLAQKPQLRGAEIFASDLGRELRRRGHEARRLFLYAGAPVDTEPGDACLGFDEASPLERLGVHPRLLLRLKRFVREYSPDVVLLNGARSVKYGACLRIAAGAMAPAIVYRNIDDPSFWVGGAARRWLYGALFMNRMNGVVALGETMLRSIRRVYGEPRRWTIIPNGVDFSRFENVDVSRPRSDGALLFVGALNRQKRPDRFVRIAAEVLERLPGCEAWIVGDGPARQACEEQARATAVGERIRFFGAKPDIGDYMGRASVLAITSDTDGIPAVVAEAAFLGVPVIAQNVGGLRDCIQSGVTGILTEPNDEGAFVATAVDLISDPSRRGEMGAAARRFAEDSFAIEAVASRYLDFFQAVLDDDTRSG